MIYFAGIGVIDNFARIEPGRNYPNIDISLIFFTNWNIIMVSVYFTLSFTSSLIGHEYGGDISDDHKLILQNWSNKTSILGKIIHVLFEVLGSTALLVTVVAFNFLNPEFEFWNITQHLMQTIAFLIEMFLNNMHVKLISLYLCLLWAVIYVCFIWIMVGTGIVKDWPYFFLNTDTSNCFLWYNGLFIGDTTFYIIW
jgi:hypothetical protein